MAVFVLSAIDRVYRTYTVAVTDDEGQPAEPSGVDAALVLPRTPFTSLTVWSGAERRPGFVLVREDWSVISTHTSLAEAVTASQAVPKSRVATRWRVLLAGPDAAATDALVVPAAGADVGLRVTDSPEVDAERVERISVS